MAFTHTLSAKSLSTALPLLAHIQDWLAWQVASHARR